MTLRIDRGVIARIDLTDQVIDVAAEAEVIEVGISAILRDRVRTVMRALSATSTTTKRNKLHQKSSIHEVREVVDAVRVEATVKVTTVRVAEVQCNRRMAVRSKALRTRITVQVAEIVGLHLLEPVLKLMREKEA